MKAPAAAAAEGEFDARRKKECTEDADGSRQRMNGVFMWSEDEDFWRWLIIRRVPEDSEQTREYDRPLIKSVSLC